MSLSQLIIFKAFLAEYLVNILINFILIKIIMNDVYDARDRSSLTILAADFLTHNWSNFLRRLVIFLHLIKLMT